MLDSPYLLALAIYLWAGIWVAWLGASPANRKNKSTFVVVLAFVLATLGWAIFLPVHVRMVEKHANSPAMKEFDSAVEKIQKAMKEAQEKKDNG